MTHTLITTGDPEDPWYVEHGTSCPTADLYGDGYCFNYVCQVGRELSNAGLPDELAELPPGEYKITHWVDQIFDRYGVPDIRDHGICLVDPEEP